MKLRIQIVVAVMGLVAMTAQAGNLGLSQNTIDFGTLKEGPPAVKKVVLTNNGSETLTIANVTTN